MRIGFKDRELEALDRLLLKYDEAQYKLERRIYKKVHKELKLREAANRAYGRRRLLDKNGIWGTCAMCPYEDSKPNPAKCENASRPDHQLTEED